MRLALLITIENRGQLHVYKSFGSFAACPLATSWTSSHPNGMDMVSAQRLSGSASLVRGARAGLALVRAAGSTGCVSGCCDRNGDDVVIFRLDRLLRDTVSRLPPVRSNGSFQ